MLNWALQLLQKNIDMKDHIRSCLEQVFRLTLLHNPNERDTTIEMLVRVSLGHARPKVSHFCVDHL
jgi:hypothetical protein